MNEIIFNLFLPVVAELKCFLRTLLTSPVDTGRKLNVHKTFKRRPERLLNILYAFNLRPVATGSLLLVIANILHMKRFFLSLEYNFEG